MNRPAPPAPAGPPHWPASVVIPTTWTPAQALVIFQLLDDLRETVAALYLDQIPAHLRQEQGGDDTAGHAVFVAGADGRATQAALTAADLLRHEIVSFRVSELVTELSSMILAIRIYKSRRRVQRTRRDLPYVSPVTGYFRHRGPPSWRGG